MSKRKIIAAAKRRGLSVANAAWEWTVGGGERYPHWVVDFGPEIDELYGESEEQFFEDTDAALQWLEDLVALPPRPEWLPIADAPQDGTRLMLWDSESKRPVFGSWRGDNPAITHYAAEPAGPEVV
ncbi:hypothetical protein [Stenotrophomonas maltophilia]|uniref:hypothetical protein n=1 Tax=Stenotrophomonas maltophilia TaxID=40324 RepID=UPI002E7A8C40|nr:hypothetical protein [Stenotrophomonas maltophilia]